MYPRSTLFTTRIWSTGCKCLLLLIVLLLAGVLITQRTLAATPHIDVMTLNSEINPASLRMVTHAIDTAQQAGAQALVMQIDTPGGDIDSMKSMVQQELASRVPIIAYVSPTGGRAASAGAFVTLAAHIAAMAPTTRIGASSPVTGSGSDIASTLKAKIENDLVASITGIQTRYNRNVTMAVQMVTDAKSYDDGLAVQEHIVDIGGESASSLQTLLNTVNGQQVKLASGQTVQLQTAGVSIQTIDELLVDSVYGLLLDPNVVFLLFIVAILGIYLEISHPGALVPGIAGTIALLLFLFGAGSLAPNWAGLILMIFACALLILDVKLPAHGVLTVGAVISFVVGALLFFNSGGPYGDSQIDPLVIYTAGGVLGLIGLTLVTFAVRARRSPVHTGAEGMIGAKATALTPLEPEGRVRYGGENWAAILDEPYTSVDAGTELLITTVEGLRLHVQPAQALLSGDKLHASTLE